MARSTVVQSGGYRTSWTRVGGGWCLCLPRTPAAGCRSEHRHERFRFAIVCRLAGRWLACILMWGEQANRTRAPVPRTLSMSMSPLSLGPLRRVHPVLSCLLLFVAETGRKAEKRKRGRRQTEEPQPTPKNTHGTGVCTCCVCSELCVLGDNGGPQRGWRLACCCGRCQDRHTAGPFGATNTAAPGPEKYTHVGISCNFLTRHVLTYVLAGRWWSWSQERPSQCAPRSKPRTPRKQQPNTL